jgi:ribosomal protein L37AE/L43A
MPSRPGWSDSYWKSLTKEEQRKLRTSCPKCGSTNTYYNPKFKVYRCIKCEHSFYVKGMGEPWWKRLFRWF